MSNYVLIGNNCNLVPYRYDLKGGVQSIPYWTTSYDGMGRPPTNFTFTHSAPRGVTSVALTNDTSKDLEISTFSPLYRRSSIMSLDGILSPISLYPTPYYSTFPIEKYDREKCPWCKGTGRLNGRVNDPRLLTNTAYTRFGMDDETNNNSEAPLHNGPDAKTFYTESSKNLANVPCSFCELETAKGIRRQQRASTNEVIPPYLIGSGNDLKIIDNRNQAYQNTNNVINRFTLNPLVCISGDFSVNAAKQSTDACVHSIDVVGYGEYNPEGGGSIKGLFSANDSPYAGEYAYQGRTYQINQRFFGLRGPVMVHGWGYDKEGYPVPNSSGELKYTENGQPITYNGVPLFKNQEIQADGSVSKPYKEKTFYKGWASTPSTWPVGPIDLRWDDGAGVWTVGANYQDVWLTIETDLIKDPVRAIMEEEMDSIPLLPAGQRRVVFVQDPVGMIKAPRGAALYCKYNTNNGFYQPIYNMPFTALGVIRSSTTADIQNTYTIKYAKNGIIEFYNGMIFANPLTKATIPGSSGIFNFMAGRWTLVDS